MRERPILFSGPMVRAILDGLKTQTRRVVKPMLFPREDFYVAKLGGFIQRQDDDKIIRCPYGVPGDRLWVRETLRTHNCFGFPLGECPQVKPIQGRVWSYAADDVQDWTGSRSSIHMPRWASRLTLDITDVRVQRLQEISEGDAIKEGFQPIIAGFSGNGGWARDRFRDLWDSINSKRSPWESNPWVWAVSFRRLDG